MTGSQLTTFTSYGRRAASARVRVFDWIDWLDISVQSETYLDGASNSASSLLRSPGKIAAAELRLRKFASRPPSNSVLVARQASPFSSGALEERVLRTAHYGVYDFDDALLHTPASPIDKLWSKSRTWKRAVSAADQVIAGNEILASDAERYSGNVVVIPSCVDPQQYCEKKNYDISAVPRAIWLGSPSTEKYLKLVARPLLHLNLTHGLRVTVISAGNATLGPLDAVVDRLEWSAETYAQQLSEADFGIMPLADNAWARGKCAYKLLQYGAAGLPLIGSPVGANDRFLKDSDGFASTSEDEWVAAMEQLLAESPAIREKRGRSARKAVVDGYSFQAWSSTWKLALGLNSHAG
jgi:glycosyltransferase involved in cell wall biosynthesis